MKLSVIVPTYNRGENIREVIQSVVEQDYSDWELLLIDDGSCDNTESVCNEFVQKDSRVRYFYKTNGGVSSARNYGLQNVSGEYIVFLDSDNSLREGALRILAGHIDKIPQIDMICYGYSSGQSNWKPDCVGKSRLVEKDEIRDRILPTHINLLPQNTDFLQNYVWNKCYRATFLSNNNILFDEKRKTWEDGIFVVNCLDKAEKVLLTSDIIYNAHCEKEVDHLSDKVFDTQLKQYLLDESEFQQRFGGEFNFNNQHYCRSNFNVVLMLLEKMVRTYGKDSIKIISDVISMPILSFWTDRIEIQNKTERIVVSAIRDENAVKIYHQYHSVRFWLHNVVRCIRERSLCLYKKHE